MKALSVLSLVFGLFALPAHASFDRAECTSPVSDNEMRLTVTQGSLFSVTFLDLNGVQTGPELLVTQLMSPSPGTTSRYVINGRMGILEIENSILEVKDGDANINGDRYHCMF